MLDSFSYMSYIGRTPIYSRGNGQYIYYECICHQPDRTPSLMGDTEDNHFWCWSRSEYFTVIRLINVYEFGDKDDKETWAQCYKRARQLNGGPLPTDDPQYARGIPKKERPKPSLEHKVLLTAAMHWWHEQLWSPASWAQSARGRRYFEQVRGVLPQAMRAHVQLGWAPPFNGIYDQRIKRSFAASLQQAMLNKLGTRDWKQPAIELGLIWKDTEEPAVRNRIMFCSTDAFSESGDCIFYQGRRADFPGVGSATPEQRKNYKYMGPKIRKAPFTLPIDSPIVPGTTHIESPVGTAVLAGYGIRSVSWLGCLSSETNLEGIGAPHWCAQDNDDPQYLKDGSIHYPGDDQAAVIAKLARARGEHAARIKPPGGEQKGVDEWVHLSGIDPYVDKLLRAYDHLPILIA